MLSVSGSLLVCVHVEVVTASLQEVLLCLEEGATDFVKILEG